MTGSARIDQLRVVARDVAEAHPLVTRLLVLSQDDAADRPTAVQWIVVVAHRDRRAEAAIVRALEAATPSPAEVFIVDERTYRLRERPASMAAALRRAVTLFTRAPETQDPGRSP